MLVTLCELHGLYTSYDHTPAIFVFVQQKCEN